MIAHLQSEAWHFKRNPQCKFTILEEIGMINKYLNGETFSNLAQEMDTNRTRLWKIATNKYNVDTYQKSSYPRDYTLNLDTFKSVTEESAYALGLIASDGHINTNNVLVVASMDHEQMKNLKGCLGCDKQLEVLSPNQYGHKSKGYKLSFGHEEMIHDILQFIPKRSKDLEFIPSQIKNSDKLSHYIRGFLDGDGSIGKENGLVVFTGKFKVMKDLAKTIKERFNINYSSLNPVTGSSSYHLGYYKKKESRELYKVLYDDATYYLTRKREAMESNLIE